MNTQNGMMSSLVGLLLAVGMILGGCEMSTSGGDYGCHAPMENGYECVAGSEW